MNLEENDDPRTVFILFHKKKDMHILHILFLGKDKFKHELNPKISTKISFLPFYPYFFYVLRVALVFSPF